MAQSRDTITLAATSLTTDVGDFLAAVDANNLDAACEMYTGRFLEGFSISNGSGFDEWRDSVARTVEGAATRALRNRLREAEAVGKWWLVERTANRLLELDPYDENAHAARIQSIAADGDYPRAVRELDGTLSLIRRDIGQPPGDLLRQLAKRLSTSTPAIDVQVQESVAQGKFVGRADEFRRLRRAWKAAVDGRVMALAVRGEGGIGKSRLCRQLLRLAAIEGGRVLSGRCFEAESQVPYAGVCDALASGARPVDLTCIDEPWRGVLGTLLPELVSSGFDPAALTNVTGDVGRRLLFEAIAQLLIGMTKRWPVALFVDDLQWADTSTRDVIQYLVHRLTDARLLLLTAFRLEEVPLSSQDRLLMGFDTLDLREMLPDEASQLIASLETLHPNSLNKRTHAQIVARGAGRPFLIIELLRFIRNAGNTADGLDDEVLLDELPAPIDALLQRRLNDLSDAAKRTLDALGVLGGQATLPLLARLTRLSSRRVAGSLDELSSRHIIQEHGARISFTHDLMREAAWRRVSNSRRRWLHKAAAVALQRMPIAAPGTIALHLQAAGETDGAHKYALDAAEHSRLVFAHAETEFFLKLAIATAPEPAKHMIALDALCQHYYSLARFASVKRLLPELRPWYSERGHREGMFIAAVAELHTALAEGQAPVAELGARIKLLAELVAGMPDMNEATAALGLILETANDAGQVGLVDALTSSIHADALRLPIGPRRAQLLAISSKAHGMLVDASVGHHRAGLALDTALAIHDAASEIVALLACGTTALCAGLYPKARLYFERALELSKHGGLQHYRDRIINNYGVLLMETGQLEDAATLLEQAAGVASVHDRLFLFGNLGLACVEQADWAGVRRCAGELEVANRVLQVPWARVIAGAMDGFAALGVGDRPRAQTVADDISRLLKLELGGCGDMSYVSIFLARLGRLGGDEHETASSLDRAAIACRRTNVGGAQRLEIERAWNLVTMDPGAARFIAEDVRRWAKEVGASRTLNRARELLVALGP